MSSMTPARTEKRQNIALNGKIAYLVQTISRLFDCVFQTINRNLHGDLQLIEIIIGGTPYLASTPEIVGLEPQKLCPNTQKPQYYCGFALYQICCTSMVVPLGFKPIFTSPVNKRSFINLLKTKCSLYQQKHYWLYFPFYTHTSR